MRVVILKGPIWTDTLLRRLSAGKETQGHLTGADAERALFFATVAGIPCNETDQGTVLDARNDADPQLYENAAAEIMGYYGRVGAEDLEPRRQMILSRAAARVIASRQQAPTHLRSAMQADAAETLSRDTPHEGFFLTRSYRLRHPQFGGEMTEALTREVFVATDAALVLPYDPVRDRVLLVEQFRMGPFGRGDPYPWVLEPVAGRVDAGETPEETARRECREEADLELAKLEHVSSHYCSPGCSTEMFHCYVGLCDLPEGGKSHGGQEVEHEDIRRHVIDFETAMDITRTGEINIGPLFALLLWLERERPRLTASA